MAKCTFCGRKGLFLRLKDGLCKDCFAAVELWQKSAPPHVSSESASIPSVSCALGSSDSEIAATAAPVQGVSDAHIPNDGRRRAFFRNGVLYKTIPAPYESIYDNREIVLMPDCIIVSDGSVYDPEDPASISSLITINPRFPDNSGISSPVLDLSYNLKMRLGVVEDKAILPAYVRKVLELMLLSPFHYSRNDYLQAIRNYYRLSMVKEGNLAELDFRKKHPEIFGISLDEGQECEHLRTKYNFEHKAHRDQEFRDMKEMFPEEVPDTIRGYSQIKSRKTKRFLAIEQAARERGYHMSFSKPYHFCEKLGEEVGIKYLRCKKSYTVNPSSGDPDAAEVVERVDLVACLCDRYLARECDGFNSYGLACVYPNPKNHHFTAQDSGILKFTKPCHLCERSSKGIPFEYEYRLNSEGYLDLVSADCEPYRNNECCGFNPMGGICVFPVSDREPQIDNIYR